MHTATVKAEGVSRAFGDTTVIRDLDLEVAEGSIHGLIGPSGSGKTTTVRMLTGILGTSGGTVRVMDTDPRRLDTDQRQRIGYMPQLGVLYPQLSIRDNLRFAAALYSVPKPAKAIREALDLLDLTGSERTRLHDASGGMQRRVALAAALMHRPQLLFLDEPTSGLDPVLRRTVWSLLQELRDDGCTIVVTTQIVSEATMCDQVSLIVDGGVLATGTPEELRRRADGGDLVDLHMADVVRVDTVHALLAQPSISAARRVGEEGRTVRVTVEDAEAAIPEVQEALAGTDAELSLTERYQTPFDDVFVQLLEARREDEDA